MLEIDGRLVSGAIELHVRSSDWLTHKHQHNPEYDRVVLHIVLENDAVNPCAGPEGEPIPTVVIEPFLNGPIEDYVERFVPVDLGAIGSRACLPTLADGRPTEIHAALRREGWRRMHEKQLSYQQEMAVRPPSDVLYRGLLDSLGLSSNRLGMAAVADTLPLQLLEGIVAGKGLSGCLATLIGIGGFMPLSPGHLSLAEIEPQLVGELESTWQEIAGELRITPVDGSVWKLNRVRPLNHPVRRLASLASLISGCGGEGLLPAMVAAAGTGPDGWDGWLSAAEPGIGLSRRRQVMVNTLAPFSAAYAEVIEDEELAERISTLWEQMTGSVDDDVARKTLRQITGGKRFAIGSALEVQGLHQIGRNGCAQLRCFECPIAALALRYEPAVLLN